MNSNYKLLMGNEAIAYGAVEAGIQVAAAYPGTPSSEIFSTLSKLSTDNDFYAEWSVNEKVALEVAAGAAYAGARAMVTMKQVGLNVASDPLMTLAYIGIKGGLVIVVADDPGPHSSQNEQDTRKFAQLAKLPVLDPSTPQEAKDMTVAAFELSEKLGLPVILRPTTRTCHICQNVLMASKESYVPKNKIGFIKDSNWVIFPNLAARRHVWLNKQQKVIKEIFANMTFNQYFSSTEASEIGIVTSGVSFNYVQESINIMGLKNISVFKIGTPYPLPKDLMVDFLTKHKKILVVEELEPVVEDQIIKIAWEEKISVEIQGKRDEIIKREGELNVDLVMHSMAKFLNVNLTETETLNMPPLPMRTPVLCAGCPHRASFYIFKQEATEDAVFTGDIGCYTLGNMPPLNAVDTCLCMGASIGIASGLKHAEPNRQIVAFLGDSTFFHSGVPALINAVYNQANITLVVLDNRTTAMTGHQPHPGLGKTAMGIESKMIKIEDIAKACGVDFVASVDPYDLTASREIAQKALRFSGPSVVIMKRECISLIKNKPQQRVINQELCIGCDTCITELGCPAIYKEDGLTKISSSCNNCSICAQICPANAIQEVE